MKKGMCELCSSKAARLHCESDEATLCWECDEKVHGANFLVAKHCRSLLCHVCQTTTPWKASGPKLFPSMSVCESCSNTRNSRIEQTEINSQPQMRNNLDNEEIKNGASDETQSDNNDGNQENSSDDDDDDDYEEYNDVEYEDAEDDDDDDDGDEDDGENQVVPWMETS